MPQCGAVPTNYPNPDLQHSTKISHGDRMIMYDCMYTMGHDGEDMNKSKVPHFLVHPVHI